MLFVLQFHTISVIATQGQKNLPQYVWASWSISPTYYQYIPHWTTNYCIYLHRQVKQRQGTENKRPCWAQSKATILHIHSSVTRSLCHSTKTDSPSISEVSSKEETSLSEYDLIILRADRCYTIVCNVKQGVIFTGSSAYKIHLPK